MNIRINGFDIVNLDMDDRAGAAHFKGVAHVENGTSLEDVPFEGVSLTGQLGFNEFFLKDPDEISDPAIREQSDRIVDVLSEHLLDVGVATGEYRDIIPLNKPL
jgi:hypothetical protein